MEKAVLPCLEQLLSSPPKGTEFPTGKLISHYPDQFPRKENIFLIPNFLMVSFPYFPERKRPVSNTALFPDSQFVLSDFVSLF